VPVCERTQSQSLSTGWFPAWEALRFGGWSLTMVSFFLVVMIPNVTDLLGGITGVSSGMFGIPQPTLFGHVLDYNEFYIVAVVLTLAWLAFTRNPRLLSLRHGPYQSSARIRYWRVRSASRSTD
jgi:branched-chain amino acid transport system permease protein